MPVEDYPEYRHDLTAGFRDLTHAEPAVMNAFSTLHGAVMFDGALTRKTKELMALAVGIAVRCDGCITLHIDAALDAGATRQEVEEAIGVAVLMGGGPAVVYGTSALTALDQLGDEKSTST